MKKIFIYGDSNLWGYDFVNNKRLQDKYQWANMLDEYLGDDFFIIQEGLPGRIAGNIDCSKKYKNGMDCFEAVFRSCSPVDYIIIALGTNDLQKQYNRKAEDIYNDLMWYKEKVNEIYNDPVYKERFFNNIMPSFIYVLPGNFDYENDAKELFDFDSFSERNELISIFTKKYSDKYVILNDIELIKGDGVHYSVKGQEMVFDAVKKVFDSIR